MRQTNNDDQRINYVIARGQTLYEMTENLLHSEEGRDLYNRGDTILVWVNEGDIDIHNMNIMLGTTNNPDEGI